MVDPRFRWALVVTAGGLALTLAAAPARASTGLGVDSLARPPAAFPTLSVAPGSAFT
jgi:hypothetical protein